MKTLKYLLIGIVFFSFSQSQAQVSVNVNIGTPPAWGPVGYTDVRYYYLPDLETYYDVSTSNYVYLNNGRWVRTRALPAAYRNYDLYNEYKVVLTDYRGDRPYDNFKTHKVKYAKGYKGKPQKTIGPKPGKGNNGHHDSGNHNGNGKGKGNGKH
ncbi:hypothetical protein ASE40_07305 [Flavobacterium sp. Root935]|uniref:hypothetical protein n=1 Tax=unclassified Flavobacterium TaxID=196869 RepID=UPI0007093A40|nr:MULTISPECIES: hypothetical protein [unclassified Flavobacterium]KRD61336.1 hypothetical protein ASE40_07305 [Flavobacterium sp. Root935]TDX12805.1 hypothetical protein EDB96_1884 [Flavobacterium sp. S87F.05.LMB.W.Kidney.N]